jgi:hypothetical protein
MQGIGIAAVVGGLAFNTLGEMMQKGKVSDTGNMFSL